MRDNSPIAVIGAGGHAKVVLATLQAAGFTAFVVYDDSPDKWGTEMMGVPVRGPVERVVEDGVPRAVIAIGDNAIRRRLSIKLRGIEWLTVVHPYAWVHSSAKLGVGTVVFAGAVIQPEARIGDHVIVNTAATIDHECVVGDYAHIAPGAHLAGRVEVGEGTFIGMGCNVIQCLQIGKWSTVGAGAVVTKPIPDQVTAVGVPARVIKRHLRGESNGNHNDSTS